MLISFRNHLFDHKYGQSGPAKLTHKINHHNLL